MLDERKASILRAVVARYIETAQPVGSTQVVESTDVGGGGAVGCLQLAQHCQGGDVGVGLRGRAARCEIVLGGGPKRNRR